jgi:hypothetical protein
MKLHDAASRQEKIAAKYFRDYRVTLALTDWMTNSSIIVSDR